VINKKINSLKNRANPPIFPLQQLICIALMHPGSFVMFSYSQISLKTWEMMFENPCAHTSLPQFPNFTLDHQSSPSSQTNINTDTLMPGLEKMSSLAFWGISFTFQGHHTHLHDLCDSPSPICMSGVSGMEGAFDGFIKITQEVPKPLHSSPARPISRLGKAPQ
jgi:hypothetical protein